MALGTSYSQSLKTHIGYDAVTISLLEKLSSNILGPRLRVYSIFLSNQDLTLGSSFQNGAIIPAYHIQALIEEMSDSFVPSSNMNSFTNTYSPLVFPLPE